MARKSASILVVDDNEDILLAARLLLSQHVEVLHTEKDPEKLPTLLSNHSYDVILLDMNFTRDLSSGQEGFEWLARILELDPAAIVILITAYGDVEMAVRAVKAGATDFVLKPWQNEKLVATVSAALSLRWSRLEAASLRQRQKQLSADLDQQYHDFIGVCPAMVEVFDTIGRVAGTDANILILGENGTGKELVARAVHRSSKRADEVFISVDIGAISASLFESELFGHIKGAFTDAREDRAGRFEIADGGTLFLDEIGNLPMSLQAKLLAVLERRQVTRVGSNTPIDIDIRLICATNQDIHKMVKEDKLRQDLLYRINTVEIKLPPLRERKPDLPYLAEHFLTGYGQKYGKPTVRLHATALRMLERYSWPGNVRELQHALERAVIMSTSTTLGPEDFSFAASRTDAEELRLEDYNLEQVQRAVILKALAKHSGNVSRAAEELGLTRASLYRRIQKYGL
ncbi:MAG: sigma-54-dependent Fis family transcriptional regulator [Candidatus Zixiibacteriota bacterium]|nr:MAG: sigma-54-dependent Fis family transcriptional regulator [candidate division Zixibacteria bacterium]